MKVYEEERAGQPQVLIKIFSGTIRPWTKALKKCGSSFWSVSSTTSTSPFNLKNLGVSMESLCHGWTILNISKTTQSVTWRIWVTSLRTNIIVDLRMRIKLNKKRPSIEYSEHRLLRSYNGAAVCVALLLTLCLCRWEIARLPISVTSSWTLSARIEWAWC